MSQVEPELLGRLVREQLPALVLYARQLCDVPEDVVQEAFLKLAQQRPSPDEPIPWLYAVVRRAALTAARSAQRRVRHEAVAARQRAAWFQPADELGLDADTATAALRELPAEEREAIVAHLWGGLSFMEIGRLMDCSDSTAHRWYVAGLTRMRERLDVLCTNPTSPRS